MARTPKPWYWKTRRSWFVTIQGKRHDLGSQKSAAVDKFHRLMAEPPKRACVIRGDSVIAVIDAFLDWCQKHRAPDTYEWYRDRLQRFAERYPTLTTAEIRPYHVQEWIDGMNGVLSGKRQRRLELRVRLALRRHDRVNLGRQRWLLFFGLTPTAIREREIVEATNARA